MANLFLTGSGVPTNAVGEVTDYYRDTASNLIYYHATLGWEVVPSLVPTPDGVGTNWLFGTGAPSNGIGATNDYYRDDDNGSVYRKHAVNGWEAKGSLDFIGVYGVQWGEGTGAPANIPSLNNLPAGSFYLDVATSDIYYKDNTLTWSNRGQLGGGGGGSGGGFAFGGEWDATPTEIMSIAAFNVPHNATITTDQLDEITSGTGFGATATNLSHSGNTGTLHEFRVTAPDTSGGGFFFVMVHDSSEQNPYLAMNDSTATVRGVGIAIGNAVSLTRDAGGMLSEPLPYTIDAGDILKVGYRSDTSAVYIYNETQSNVQLIGGSFIDGFADGLENLSIYSMGAGSSLSFDFTSAFPLEQSVFNFDYPEDLSKTYLATNVTEQSIINGTLVKTGDYVNFYESDDVTHVVVCRDQENNIDTKFDEAKTYAESLVVGLWDDRGGFDASSGAYPNTGGSGVDGAIRKGDLWTITVAGTLPTDQIVELGDTARALVDEAGNTEADWAIAQNNIGYVPENTTNKSTDNSLGISDILYPTQKAVKEYVDNTTLKPTNTRYTVNPQTDTTYTVVAGDISATGQVIVKCTNAATIAVTLATPSSLGKTTGDSVNIRQGGAGVVTVTGSLEGNGVFTAQHETKTFIAQADNTWLVVGG